MFCLCLCRRICLCVCLCRRICHLQMNPGAVLFSAMYDMWVAMLKSLECGCLSIIGLQRELTEVIYPLYGGYTWWRWKPRLGRHPMGPTKTNTASSQCQGQLCWVSSLPMHCSNILLSSFFANFVIHWCQLANILYYFVNWPSHGEGNSSPIIPIFLRFSHFKSTFHWSSVTEGVIP